MVWRFLETATNLRRLLEKIKYLPGDKFSAQFLFLINFILLLLLPVSCAEIL